MTDDLGHGVDAHNENEQDTTDSEIASTSEIVTGAEGADELVGQADLNIEQPGDGQVLPITAAAGQRYTVVDPDVPRVELDGTSLILVYPNDGRVVFQNLGDVVNLPDAPIFVIAGVPIPSATIYNNAVALVGQPLPNVAAPTDPQGTGETQYRDDPGETIDLLDPLGVLDGTVLSSGLLDVTEPKEIFGSLLNPPVDFDVNVTANFFETLPFTFAPGLRPDTGPAGKAFVLDDEDGRILEIGLDGSVRVVVDTAEILNASGGGSVDFGNRGIAFDSEGNLYFTDGASHAVFVKPADGGPVRLLTSEAAIQAAAGFAEPKDLTFAADGFLYAAEENSDSILKIDPITGDVSVLVTKGQFLDLLGALVDHPELVSNSPRVDLDGGIIANADGTTLYVTSDGEPEAIFAIDLTTGTPSILTADPVFRDLDVYITLAPNGDIIAADDAGGDTIYRVTPDGTVTVFLSETQLESVVGGEVDLEGGIWFDSDSNFYVAEENTDSIYRWSAGTTPGSIDVSSGAPFLSGSQIEAQTGGFPDFDGGAVFREETPTSFGSVVLTEPQVGEDFVFVVDRGGNILKVSLDGKRITTAVSEDEIVDAIDGSVELHEGGVVVDAAGNIFFTSDNFVLVKSIVTGETTVIASGATDPLLSNLDAKALVLGPDGSLFVADATGSGGRVIQVSDPLGSPVVSELVTSAQIEALPDVSSFRLDEGIAISLNGETLYITNEDDPPGIVAVDIATGTPSLVALSSNPFTDLDDVLIVAPNGDIIVSDNELNELFRIDPETGDVSIFLSREDIAKAADIDPSSVNTEAGFAFDAAGNFYLAEQESASILMWPSLDPSTGEVVRSVGMVLADRDQLSDAAGGSDIDLNGGLTIGFMPMPADQFVVTYSGIAEMDDYYGEVFTVVRTQENGNGSGTLDIYARFVSPDGTRLGEEFQVNSFTAAGAHDLLPDVAALRGGGFVVTWTALVGDLNIDGGEDFGFLEGLGGVEDLGDLDIEALVVVARIFDSTGRPLGPEFPVTTFESLDDSAQFISKAAGLNNGSFVITWTELSEADHGQANGDVAYTRYDYDYGLPEVDIFARQFTPSGVPVGPAFQVNTLDGIQAISDVAQLEDGGFAVVFTGLSANLNGAEGGIGETLEALDVFVRLYDADCNPRGESEILITTVPDGVQALVKVTGLQDGNVLATWTDVDGESGITVKGRVIGPDGEFAGEEFQITEGPSGAQILSSAAALPGGKFFVSWTEIGGINSEPNGVSQHVEIRGQVFDADGTRIGDSFQVSQAADGYEFAALSTQAALGGAVLVTWTQFDPGLRGAEVFGQLYSVDGGATDGAVAIGDPFVINDDTDPALLSSVAALQNSFEGGFIYEFQVGEAEIVLDNIHGTDIEDGVTTQFTITTLPTDQDGNQTGLLLIDRGDDNVIDEIYGGTFDPLPGGGLSVETGDSVFYLLPAGFEVKPDLVTFNYFTTDSDSLTSLNDGPATVSIDFPDVEPKLIFLTDCVKVDEDDIVPMDGGEGMPDSPQAPGTDTLEDADPSFDPVDPQPTTVSGTIFADFGFDRPGEALFTQATIDAIEALGLKSTTFKDEDGNGLPLLFTLAGDGRSLIAYADIGDVEGEFDQIDGPEDTGDSIVFMVTLAPSESNVGEFTYTFKLFGSIEHEPPMEVLFIGDDESNGILKVSLDGEKIEVAVSEEEIADVINGPVDLNESGVVVDAVGNIFFTTDQVNDGQPEFVLVKLADTGEVEVVAQGTGSETDLLFDPEGLALGSDGTLYVLEDDGGPRVTKIEDPLGTPSVSELAGRGDIEDAIAAKLVEEGITDDVSNVSDVDFDIDQGIAISPDGQTLYLPVFGIDTSVGAYSSGTEVLGSADIARNAVIAVDAVSGAVTVLTTLIGEASLFDQLDEFIAVAPDGFIIVVDDGDEGTDTVYRVNPTDGSTEVFLSQAQLEAANGDNPVDLDAGFRFDSDGNFYIGTQTDDDTGENAEAILKFPALDGRPGLVDGDAGEILAGTPAITDVTGESRADFGADLDIGAMAEGDNRIDLHLPFIVSDIDGDTAEGSFKVAVVDDMPVVEDTKALVDEDGLPERPQEFIFFIEESETDVDEVPEGVILKSTPDGSRVEVAVSRADIIAAIGLDDAADLDLDESGLVFDKAGNLFFTTDPSSGDNPFQYILVKRADTGEVQVVASTSTVNDAAKVNDALDELDLNDSEAFDPEGLAIDGEGTLYVLDDAGSDAPGIENRILKIEDPTGARIISEVINEDQIETLSDISNVKFDTGITISPDGNILYVPTEGSPQGLIKIDLTTLNAKAVPPTGVSLLAPADLTGTNPFDDADNFVAIAPNGDIIVADDGADKLLRVNKDTGKVDDFVTEAQLEEASGGGEVNIDAEGGFAFDSAGNFYVAQDFNSPSATKGVVLKFPVVDLEEGTIDPDAGFVLVSNTTIALTSGVLEQLVDLEADLAVFTAPAGNAGIGDIRSDGDDIDPDRVEDETMFAGKLNAAFGADGPGDIDFAGLHGTPVVDSDGVPVTSRGVDLVYRWDGDTHTLTAVTTDEPDVSEGLFAFSISGGGNAGDENVDSVPPELIKTNVLTGESEIIGPLPTPDGIGDFEGLAFGTGVDADFLFAYDEVNDALLKIDPATGEVVATWTLDGGSDPTIEDVGITFGPGGGIFLLEQDEGLFRLERTGTDGGTFELIPISRDTLGLTDPVTGAPLQLESLAADPTDPSVFYALADSSDGDLVEVTRLVKITIGDPDLVEVLTGTIPFESNFDVAGQTGLAFAPDGTLWGLVENDTTTSVVRSVAFQIDPETGAAIDGTAVELPNGRGGFESLAMTAGAVSTVPTFREIFTVEITDVAEAEYKVSLIDQVDHPVASTEDNIDLDLRYRITDFDGDSKIGSLKLSIDDDLPIVGEQEEALVDEDGLLGGTLFTVDDGNDIILKITLDGREPSIAVSQEEIVAAIGVEGNLDENGVVLDADGNIFFTTETGSGEEFVLVKRAGASDVEIVASTSSINTALGDPTGVFGPEDLVLAPDGSLFVLDDGNEDGAPGIERVIKIADPLGTPVITELLTEADIERVPEISFFHTDQAIALSPDGTKMYLLSEGSPLGVVEVDLTTLDTSPIPPDLPIGISLLTPADNDFVRLNDFMTVAPNGDIIVTDDRNEGLEDTPDPDPDIVYRIDKDTGEISVFLTPEQVAAAAGAGTADVDLEGGMRFDAQGNFYLAEDGTNRILKWSADTDNPDNLIDPDSGRIFFSASDALNKLGLGNLDLDGGLDIAGVPSVDVGIPGGPWDEPDPDRNEDGDHNEATTSGRLVYAFGADGPGDVVFDAKGVEVFAESGGDPIELSSNGDPVTFVYDAATHTLTGVAKEGEPDARKVIEIQLINLATGDYRVTLLDGLDNPETDDPGTPGTETSFEDHLFIHVPFTVTDFDGDSVSSSFNVVVNDDTPLIDGGEGGVLHDETAGIDDNSDDVNPEGTPQGLAMAITALGLEPIGLAQGDPNLVTFEVGADGPGKLSLTDMNGDLFNGLNSGLMRTSDGLELLLFSDPEDPRLVLGRDALRDAPISFQIVDGTGSIINLNVASDTINLPEHNLVTGQMVTYSVQGSAQGAIGNLAVNGMFFAIVVDPNTIKLAATQEEALAGTAIDLMEPARVDVDVIAHVIDPVGGKVSFALYMDESDNSLWVAQFDALEHPNFLNPDDPVSLANKVYVTVTDADGDSATTVHSPDIFFRDDGPTANVDEPLGVAEHGTTGTDFGGVNLLDNDDFGTDGPGPASGGIIAFMYDSVGDGMLDATVLADATVTTGIGGVLTINADGTWEYEAPDDVTGPVSDPFDYTIQDGDRDTSTASNEVLIYDTVTLADLPAGTIVHHSGPADEVQETLTGTASTPDLFLYEPGDGDDGNPLFMADLIEGFEDGTDLIGLTGGLIPTDITVRDDGAGGSVISTSAEVLAVVQNVATTAIDDADFVVVV